VPPGTVPEQNGGPTAADEQYGQEVLGQLSQQFQLDRDDARVNRVRDIVDKLTKAAHADKNPWHVYVFDDTEFKNAAATKGNYVFVWSGILASVQSDDELSTILAHEIGHVLAGHTSPTPGEEANEMISNSVGEVAKEVVNQQPGYIGLAAGLAGLLVSEGVKAFIVNPESQRKEFEADQIGLFLMARAGYDPQEAINFWRRVENDPEFSSGLPQFMSSHPASDERVVILEKLLPEAQAEYRSQKNDFVYSAKDTESRTKKARNRAKKFDEQQFAKATKPTHKTSSVYDSPEPSWKADNLEPEKWVVVDQSVHVYATPDDQSSVVSELNRDEVVTVESLHKRWLEISKPVVGYVRSTSMAPKE
jgi:predicted Zn-dependent protease